MYKTWLIIKHEYLRHVLRKRFIVTLISFPLLIAVSGGVGYFSTFLGIDKTPVGYIDRAGVLTNPVQLSEDATGSMPVLTMIPYQDEKLAREDLNAEKIQALFSLEPDYLQTGNVKMLALTAPDGEVISQFKDFLRINLIRTLPAEITHRLSDGINLEYRSIDVSNVTEENNLWNILIPAFAGILLIMAITTSGGYLLQAVVEEKENRTMEIIITSVSPNQLMIGKTIGNLSVGLTQLVTWIIFGFIGIKAVLPAISNVRITSINTDALIVTVLTFIPAFIMIASLMAALGATATQSQEAQQISGLFTIPLILPFWMIGSITENPNGPIATILSLIPFTSPVTLPLRVATGTTPFSQILLALGLLYAFMIASLWLSGKAFRLGMLQYGKRISLREIFRPSRLTKDSTHE